MPTLTPSRPALSTNHLSLWHTRCPVPTAFSLALHLGALEEEFSAKGISWKSLQETGNPKVIQSHFSHTQENSFRQGGNIPALWAKSTGAETRLIGLSWVETPYLILSLPDSGIRTPADLKGKRLLVLRRSREAAVDFFRATTLRTYEVALESAGLSLRDVTLVEIPIGQLYADAHQHPTPEDKILAQRGAQKEAVASLLRSEVDVIAVQLAVGVDLAAFIGAFTVVDLRQSGLGRSARTNNGAPRTLTVSAGLADEYPEVVAEVVAHLLEASAWAQFHHQEVVRLVAREEHVSEEIIEVTYGRELSQSFETDLSEENIAALRSQKDFLLRHGFLAKDFDLDGWIDPRPLERAREILVERKAAFADD